MKTAAAIFMVLVTVAPAFANDQIGTFETPAFAELKRVEAVMKAGPPLGLDEIESTRTQLAVSIPTEPPEGGAHALDALIYAPKSTPDGFRRPAIVITHGNPRNTRQQRSTRLHRYGHLAEEFARRGYVAAVVARRGFARSSGHYVGWYGQCDTVKVDGYERAGRTGAQDLRAALQSLAQDPRVDPDQMLALGISGGGFAALALASEKDAPRGVVAFAPGRGSPRDGENCNAKALSGAFTRFGTKRAKPSLWLFSTTDRFFGPDMAHGHLERFNGPARMVVTGPILHADDGHRLYQRGNTALWRPAIDAFLRDIGMPTWTMPPEDPTDLNLPPPDGLSERGLAAWREFLGSEVTRAFAIGSEGRFGWGSGYRNARIAKRRALEACNSGSQSELPEVEDDCTIHRTDEKHQ